MIFAISISIYLAFAFVLILLLCLLTKYFHHRLNNVSVNSVVNGMADEVESHTSLDDL
jgi:hypothetical protein